MDPSPSPGYGGVESVVGALTEALIRRGHEVTLFCASGSESSARVVELLTVSHPDEIERSLYEADHVARAFERIEATDGEDRFDLVHDHCGFTALAMADRLRTPLVHMLHGPFTAATGASATTLRVLAARQASGRDDFHEMEPGKIPHELRFGELTARGERPYSPYFGSADATPLFLVLLDEYHRWTDDAALVRELEPNARAALRWIAESGDRDGDGYVEYERRNRACGLINQCWKDSRDAIQFADGSLARGPIATAEIQGYAYDAQLRAGRLAREVWGDPALASELEQRTEALRLAFRRDFWMPDRGYHALALDGEKRQVDSLTSNIGHLLWSGILGESEAAAVADRLLGEELFSGWGVRTLGTEEAGYNPLGYHVGTVWPHDNSLIVAGLARYGHHAAAAKIAAAMLDAAPFFGHRLPEVFADFPRSMTSVPVAFPTASRPQAWAAGTPLLLVTTLLGLGPQSGEERFEPSPASPCTGPLPTAIRPPWAPRGAA